MLKISRRSRLSDPSGVRFICHLHRDEAQQKLSAGCIVADETKAGEIVSFRLTMSRVATSVQAGSFGIRREHVPVGREYGLSGGVIFSHHRNLHETESRHA